MSQMFYFSISCEVNRTEGKFASRDDIADELRSNIEGADPGSISVGEGEYEVSSFEVSDEEAPKPARKTVTEPLKREPTQYSRLRVLERVLAAEAPYDAVAAWMLTETRTQLDVERAARAAAEAERAARRNAKAKLTLVKSDETTTNGDATASQEGA